MFMRNKTYVSIYNDIVSVYKFFVPILRKVADSGLHRFIGTYIIDPILVKTDWY